MGYEICVKIGRKPTNEDEEINIKFILKVWNLIEIIKE